MTKQGVGRGPIYLAVWLGAVAVSLILATLSSPGAQSFAQESTLGGGDQVDREIRKAGAKGLTWRQCEDPAKADLQCATFKVPINWYRPSQGTVKLAVYRLKSTGKGSGHVPSIFMNPGGPGGPITQSFMEKLDIGKIRRKFHVVAWDARGVGESQPKIRGCATVPTSGEFLPQTGTIDWKRQVKRAIRLGKPDRKCLIRNRPLSKQMGTLNVIRDLNALRVAVGDTKLTYFGTSYGTRIGRLFAQAYPGQTGRMLLDGVVGPNEKYPELGKNGRKATLQAIKVANRSLTSAQKAARRQLLAYLETNGTFDLFGQTYNRFTVWELATSASTGNFYCLAAEQNGIYTCPGYQADATDGEVSSAATMSTLYSLINCADVAGRPGAGKITQTIKPKNSSLRQQAATLTGFVYGTACSAMPQAWEPLPAMPQVALRTPPLLLNGKFDTQTTYKGARETARKFTGGRLITVKTRAHALFNPNDKDCIKKPVLRYLTKGRLPKQNRTCPADAFRG